MVARPRARRVRIVLAGSCALLLAFPFSGPAAGQVSDSLLDRQPLDVAAVLAARYPQAATLSYIPALSWSGSLWMAALTGDDDWQDRALRQMTPYLRAERPALAEPYRLTNLGGLAAFADLASVADLPAAGALARQAADLILPREPTELVRFPTGWSDDMYMASALWARVAASTGEERYGRAATRMLMGYAAKLQREDGLFVHAEEGPFAWGRGNGFAALGLAEALAYLPEGTPDRDRLLEIFRRQVGALLPHQSAEGAWRQIVDEPESYLELTVTAMSVAAMARGVRLGWIPAEDFLPAIERGWRAVLARVDADGAVRDACTSTPAGTTKEFYLQRAVVNGPDDRAGGLVLLAALEMEELWRARL